MTRLQNSWALAKASWSVLQAEKDLVWIPFLSTVCSVLVLAVAGALIYTTGGRTTSVDGTKHWHGNAATVLLTLCAYVAVAFVATYFLAALCAAANERLQGRDTTLGRALRIANTRLHRILPWAVVSATVSVVIRQLEQRGMVGRIVASMIGLAWTLVTFLAVPVIVFEDLGPINALKRSASLFKQTWGENVVAYLGFNALGVVVAVPAIALIVLGAATGVTAVAVFCVAVAVAWIVATSMVLAALSGIYRTALYRYALDGAVPAPFAAAGIDLAGAFGPRGDRPRLRGAPGDGGPPWASPV